MLLRIEVVDGPGRGRILRYRGNGRSLRVGSAPDCDLVLPDEAIAPEHIGLEVDPRGVYFVVAEGAGAVFHNEQSVDHGPLEDGDWLGVGGADLHVRIVQETAGPRCFQCKRGIDLSDVSDETALEVAGRHLCPRCGQDDRRLEGTQVGPYRLEAISGLGRIGTYFDGTHTAMGMPVTLKVLRITPWLSLGQTRRFLRESRYLACLSHPNLVRIHDAGGEKGLYYLALERFTGVPVERVVADEGPLPLARALAIAVRVADAVRYLHREKVIHRDLNPSAVTVDEEGHVKLTHLGYARAAPDAGLESQGITGSGNRSETSIRYCPVEQLRSPQEVDGRADIYGLGALLYFMLGGRAPYGGVPTQLYLQTLLQRGPRPLDELRAGLPAPVVALVARCMARQPEDRYPDMDALLAELEPLARQARSWTPA